MTAQIEIVNIVWKGLVCATFHLNELCLLAAALPLVTKATYQERQPQQLIIKFGDGSTMIAFKTGRFRILGKTLTSSNAHYNAYSVTSLVHSCSPIVTLQTMTAVYSHPQRFNLLQLTTCLQGSECKTQCHYDAEHFPAVQVISFRPIHVNVFASGKVIICGLKSVDCADSIINKLLLHSYKLCQACELY